MFPLILRYMFGFCIFFEARAHVPNLVNPRRSLLQAKFVSFTYNRVRNKGGRGMPPNSFSGAAIFRGLGHAHKTVLFRKNQIIFSHGDSSESLFYITKGIVKLTLTSALGKEAVISFLGRGDFIGESCLCSNAPTRFHTATALTELTVVKLDRTAILHSLRADAEIALLLIAYLVRRNQQIQEDFVAMLLSSSEQRLARVLSMLSGLGPTNEEKPGPKVTQQDLANMLGITRQRVNFLIKRLRT